MVNKSFQDYTLFMDEIILIRRLFAIKVMRLHPIHFTNRLEELHKEQRCFL